MATIKNLTVNADRSVTLVTDTGDILSMPSALAGILREQYVKHDYRDAIRNTVEDMDGEDIAVGSLDITEDEFIGEVFAQLEDEIEYGNYPSEEAVRNAIIYTAECYGICIDE